MGARKDKEHVKRHTAAHALLAPIAIAEWHTVAEDRIPLILYRGVLYSRTGRERVAQISATSSGVSREVSHSFTSEALNIMAWMEQPGTQNNFRCFHYT
jgi:hypothetical protein